MTPTSSESGSANEYASCADQLGYFYHPSLSVFSRYPMVEPPEEDQCFHHRPSMKTGRSQGNMSWNASAVSSSCPDPLISAWPQRRAFPICWRTLFQTTALLLIRLGGSCS